MKTREGRLINARFANLECNMIRCEFKDYERPEGDNLSVQMHHYNPENKFVKQILAEYTEEDLERNYVQFSKMETLRKQMFEKFVERFDEIIDYLDSGTPAQEVVEKEITLQSIRDLGNNSEAFFKLKLEIFELEEVKASKNRQWKAAMRKATTTLELLGLLHEVYATLENEEGERQD